MLGYQGANHSLGKAGRAEIPRNPLASSNQQFSVKTKGSSVPIAPPWAARSKSPRTRSVACFPCAFPRPRGHTTLDSAVLWGEPKMCPDQKSLNPSDSKGAGQKGPEHLQEASQSPPGPQGPGCPSTPGSSVFKAFAATSHTTWATAASPPLPGLDGKGQPSHTSMSRKQGQTQTLPRGGKGNSQRQAQRG